MLARAHERGIRAAFVVGDEVYGGRQLRRAVCARGMGYVLVIHAIASSLPARGQTMIAAHADSEICLIPVTIPEMLRMLLMLRGMG